MKKKILVLTNIYTDPKVNLLNSTNVCHYFVREWVEMGYEVKVIYNYTIYSKLLHFIAGFFEKIIANRSLSIVNTKRVKEDEEYIIEGVKVYKFPIYKFIPRIKFSKDVIRNQIAKILDSNNKEEFIPDVIIGHFHNPSLEMLSLLKKEYKVKTCLILHGYTDNIKEHYKSEYSRLIDDVDVWGYRSSAIGKRFENIYGERERTFICHSGIPQDFILKDNLKSNLNVINKFIYVGALIKRKNPVSLLYALNKVYDEHEFSLTYIGDGSEVKEINKFTDDFDLSNVKIFSRLSRVSVAEKMNESDCFIMISENETFGLVYLEAMAKGCITIGSRNEGIDGVIIDGENGFLCEPGNYNELADIIVRINKLSLIERNKISLNAINTANTLTDVKAAKRYIDNVFSL